MDGVPWICAGACLGYRCLSGYSETFNPAPPEAMTTAAQTADPQASLAPLGAAFPPDFPPAWASAWGEDVYGWYAEFVVSEVWQRCRWIPPGRFWMGSPEKEEGRFADGDWAETQHHVTLTQGFWLADTACTQAMWQAVMGTNPASYQGEGAGTDHPSEHPVDSVSWDDVASGEYDPNVRGESCFLERLNYLIPELNAGLPTTAQWEWACRADVRGLLDPLQYAIGRKITIVQANNVGRYPYGHEQEDEFVGHTVPVKTLKPNAWGLYLMHGNVWEWCSDRGALNPPLMSSLSGIGRALRGGSWDDNARDVRQMFRDGAPNDFRYRYIGFRLAPGQSSTGSRAAEPPGGQELGRGTRTGR